MSNPPKMEVDDKLLAEELKEKQKACTDMNQLQALWTDMAKKQVLKPKPPPVLNKKRGRPPKAKAKVELDEMTGQESNQNINYAYKNSQLHFLESGDQSSDFNWFAKHVDEHKREQMEIDSDPLKNLKTEDGLISNPWTGKDISAFLKYCCPECEFNNLDSQVFTEHALENHINATALFSQKIGVNFEPDIKIELEDDHFVGISNVDEIRDLDLNPIKRPRKKKAKGSVKQKQESIVQEQVLCEVCPILDLTTSALKIRSHKHKNHKCGKQFCCPHCEYTSPVKQSWSIMLTHVSSKHQEHYEDKFFCEICAKGFLFLQLYTSHKKNAHVEKEKIHICDTCGYHSKTMEQLSNHVLLKHNFEGATKLFCEKCGYSTVSKIVLRSHMFHKHDIEKHKKCQYCEYRSPLTAKVHQHIDNNHPEKEEKNFLCEKCNKSFIYKATFTDHSKYKCKYSDYLDKRKEQKIKRQMKNNIIYKSFQCDYCEEVIRTKTSSRIKQHYKMFHCGLPILEKNHKRFDCSNCNDVFLFEDELNCHRNLEHGIKTEKNYCRKCRMAYVETHICFKDNNFPSQVKKYPCDQCSKIYASKPALNGHVKTVHEKQLDFECSICGKQVGSKNKLSNHIFSCHSQVTCDICNKVIANPYDLKKHKLSVHKDTTGVWLCQSCPKKAFFTKSMFDRHMKENHSSSRITAKGLGFQKYTNLK